jgi:hypothetical protein
VTERDRTSLGELARLWDALSAPVRNLFATTTLLGAAFAASALIKKTLEYLKLRNQVEELQRVFDLNPHLAEVFSVLIFALFFFFLNKSFSSHRRTRTAAQTGLALLSIGIPLLLWQGTKNQFFTSEGTAIKCYVITRDGVRYGEHPGDIDALTGSKCLPITADIVERVQRYAQGDRPKPIDVDNPAFFDFRTGKAIVWHSRDTNGRIELFDLMGYQPETRKELLPVNEEVVAEWKRQVAAIKEEEQRPRPRRIEPTNYPFFDTLTGRPRVWYTRDAAGNFEFFDSPGFHPATSAELKPVDTQTAKLWEGQRRLQSQRDPQIVDPEKYAPFDVKTSNPRIWYWRGSGGEYEFFDNPGFHPRTGDPLQQITRDVMTEWRKDKDAVIRKLNEERLRQEEERKRREAQAEKDRLKAEDDRKRAELQAQTERLKVEEEQKRKETAQQREQQSGALCDQLAANPTDPRKPSNILGVRYEELKQHTKEALESCSLAMQKFPNDLHYTYQYARALQNEDASKAAEIHGRLAQQQYPAAYDNLGWMVIKLTKDYSAAAQFFREGIRRGDADSMVSLADLIDRGYATSQSSGESKWTLLARAAQLGHVGAKTALEKERAK